MTVPHLDGLNSQEEYILAKQLMEDFKLDETTACWIVENLGSKYGWKSPTEVGDVTVEARKEGAARAASEVEKELKDLKDNLDDLSDRLGAEHHIILSLQGLIYNLEQELKKLRTEIDAMHASKITITPYPNVNPYPNSPGITWTNNSSSYTNAIKKVKNSE